MAHEKILSELKAGKYRPVYFLQGDEPYFIDLISDYIQEHALTEDERSFNQSVLYGLDTDVATVVSEAKRFPMMAERQVVIVKEAHKLRNLIPNESGDEDKPVKKKEPEKKGELLAYCEKPQPTTVLVICHKYKKIDTRKKKAKDLLAAIETNGGVVFTSERIKDYKVAEWIQAHVTQQGYRIDPRTSGILAEYLGNDLGKIMNELGKLYISMKPGGNVTPELIEQNIGISKDYNMFELQSALVARDVFKANRIIAHYAYNPKDHPIQMLLPVLHSFFFKVALMHHVQRSQGKLDAARTLGVAPFFLKDYQQAAAVFNDKRVRTIMARLREADIRSKGVDNPSTGHGDIMKELVYHILH
jgi:DNA polymerase III subunit delta